jgi:hypothetical protein
MDIGHRKTPWNPTVPHHARHAALLLLLTLAACGKSAPIAQFAGTAPAFDPLAFWSGHHRSWGVLEDRGGAPTDTVITDCVGTPAADGSLHMAQTLTLGDGTRTHRDWHLWRTGPAAYAATANDMVGQAAGTASGRVFHWSWVLALSPGNPLKNVLMDQWMYLYPDGTMMNRTTIRKLGVVLAEVSEQFSPVEP